ncbi:MAG: hypothetical protein O4861_14870 [Trichodesmium sp. St16_bin4-tuft]|nr:hypothetical protein [Trichodesmium sp. MAG_R01]MDE5068316.1 hypothetical protein [Trichodesmium sp. St4_bin8_1]MDE5073946.1 hypothetical protein [Trichodesmium sp. St5_bin8]MDE5077745.1 hypothetical protein [Trichodesmium sp. St2_bin6]MDE5090435.1 hypothetical protein [Trichodesmium sp. St18_bin3_1_1]MDE5099540.1 hypothetical protein [Trichodesmium sp. St16_bin4-tuft]MDE5104013.1 hypothetical protein [Trichodesmium sp. St19_bin2]
MVIFIDFKPLVLNNPSKELYEPSVVLDLGKFFSKNAQISCGCYWVIKQLKVVTNNPHLYQKTAKLFQGEAGILAELGDTHSHIYKLYANFADRADKFYLDRRRNSR